MNRRIHIFLFLLAALLCGCSTTRSLNDGEYLLRKTSVKVAQKDFNASELNSYIGQKPNNYVLGLNPFLSIYNWGGKGETAFGRFLQKISEAPVVYDASKVDETIEHIQSHLRYIGYYGSQVESQVSVKGRKVYVYYYVVLGKRYPISAIEYELPDYGTFRKDFAADLPHTTIATGQYLAESALEAESERSAAFFRTQGYYGFTRNYYAFEADTLSGDGTARLKVAIRDYALGDLPESAREHKKFTLGQVSIAYPENLKIRTSMLENLNILRPGMPYSEREVNNNYTRFASVGMFSGVNVNMTPVSDDKVDCTISLRNPVLQGFKVNLEASVNSTGLFGISPQLSYYHRNIFHGGESLTMGVKGNFQFKPGTDAYSTEVSVTSTLRFPMFLGLPNRIFSGPNIPKTDISLSFSYQDRPEYKRTFISTSYSYNGRMGTRWLYQIIPFRANISRLFNVDDNFFFKLLQSNPFLLMAYMDHFDLGVGTSVYYTTDASSIPQTPYHYVRFGLDLSGNVLSLLNRWLPTNEYGEHTIWETPYNQYIRFEAHLGRVFRFGREDRHALALHMMGGAGFAYGNSTSMPLEKQFYAGGSSSMRGWQARTLGPGNSSLLTLFSIPSQTGDMKLEANVEYRFPLFWKLEGALFVDAGNVWDIQPPGEEEDSDSYFHLENLSQSLGLDWGLGIRVNLNFILVRLDGGIRLHDPTRDINNRWVAPKEWFNGNYAIHFGVGYPF